MTDLLRLQWGRARASAEMREKMIALARSGWASMGPRSCERGNPTSRERSAHVAGAASMGPRSCERGNIVRVPHPSLYRMLLQWGRARASAEISDRWRISRSGSRLQWGRARASAEIDYGAHRSIRVGRLQWGRARASAEMAPTVTATVTPARFNGAALVRARK